MFSQKFFHFSLVVNSSTLHKMQILSFIYEVEKFTQNTKFVVENYQAMVQITSALSFDLL